MIDEIETKHGVKEIFLVMQGGGAKGIAHAGGLIAIEEEKLIVKGVAGTSAGSIAAALVAAGYSGRDLADPEEKKHIFLRPPFGKKKGDLPYSKPTQLFTLQGWLILYLLKSLPGLFKGILLPVKKTWGLMLWWCFLIGLPLGALIGLAMRAPEAFDAYSTGLWQLVVLVAPWTLGFLIICLVWALWGITSVRNVRKIIDLTLARKLKERLEKVGIKKDGDITFEDMEKAGCPSLKIIATNTATESLELFCAERTPDVAVADAVAASICLPIIFKPKKLRFTRRTPFDDLPMTGRFLDGGLVSNLPAWALDEERLLHPGVPTIALSLSPPSPVNSKFWISALTGTVVNGSSEVHTRTPNKILTVALSTKTTLLDFDLPANDVYKEVANARSRVMQELSIALRGPLVLQEAVEGLYGELQKVFSLFRGSLYRGHAKDRLRVAIAVQRGNSMKSLSTAFTYGYRKDDPDERLTVLIKDSHPGAAWLGREVIADDLKNGVRPRHTISPSSWADRTWILCLPIVFDAQPGQKARPFVFIIDCNLAFDRASPDFEDLYNEFCTFITLTAERYTGNTNLARFAQGANTWL
ncbi:patatin-like phospholipase family protein [Pseudomonas sp. MWU12-3103b]|uniref:patatin-like phospholipase family protein n=1 Tax=Pseudomonas sp. MWU12-3103b TaxID=2928857 RepID=UPI001FFFB989|nr:patatin-like phospholipase family protein [Pseudomonas sp. MWU12-3103b]